MGTGRLQFFQAVCIGNPDKPLTARTERITWNHAHLFFLQQTHAEVIAGKSGRRDVRKHIECTFRHRCMKAHLIQLADQEVSSGFERLTMHVDISVRTL